MMIYQWKILIAHVDMDAFYASIEQLKDPSLRQQPVCVTSGPNSRTIIAASYEAKKLGCKVGMHVPPHKGIHIRYADLATYHVVSGKIMNCLTDICPNIEIFSIDEAYLDLSGMQHIYPSEAVIIQNIKTKIFEITGLNCSIGLAENKPLAKLASKENKPNGSYIVSPGEGYQYLQDKPVEALCGIGPKTKIFLNSHGVIYCQDIHKIPISLLSSKFGQKGREIKRMCLGEGSSLLLKPRAIAQTMGNSRMIKPAYYQEDEISQSFRALSIKLATRLREQLLFAQKATISIKTKDKTITYQHSFSQGAQYHSDIKVAYHILIKNIAWPIFIRKISIQTSNLQHALQEDLLNPSKISAESVIDAINLRWKDSINLGVKQ